MTETKMIGEYYVWDAESLEGWNNEKLAAALKEPLAELGLEVEIKNHLDNFYFYDQDMEDDDALMPWDLDRIRAEAEHIIEKIIQDGGIIHEFLIRGFEAVEKTVASGNKSSARINVPPSWQGKRVILIRLE